MEKDSPVQIYTPRQPNPALQPKKSPYYRSPVRKFVPEEAIAEIGRVRLSEIHTVMKNNAGAVLCYEAENPTAAGGQWIPELRLGTNVNHFKNRVLAALNSTDHRGDCFRDGDTNLIVTRFLKGPGGKLPPGWDTVPTVHDSANPLHGRFPHNNGMSPAGTRVRIRRILPDLNVQPDGTVIERPTVLTPRPLEKEPAKLATEKFPFKSTPTDAMTIARFNPANGIWEAQTLPYGALSMDPWKSPFHYGDGDIGGMIAFAFDDGIYTFRPDKHAERFVRDMRACQYPAFSAMAFSQLLAHQLHADRRWIPPARNQVGNRYYVRPTVFPFVDGPPLSGPEGFMMIIGTPAGPFIIDTNTQKLYVREMGPRPVIPGLSTAKSSLAYAEAVRQFRRYREKGYHEALHFTRKGCAQEGISANMLVVKQGESGKIEIISPHPESFGVLPGITVKSVKELAEARGYRFTFGRVTGEDVKTALEVGMTGTAMGIAEVGTIEGNNGVLYEKKGGMGNVLADLRRDLELIMTRNPEAPEQFRHWMAKVEPPQG